MGTKFLFDPNCYLESIQVYICTNINSPVICYSLKRDSVVVTIARAGLSMSTRTDGADSAAVASLNSSVEDGSIVSSHVAICL